MPGPSFEGRRKRRSQMALELVVKFLAADQDDTAEAVVSVGKGPRSVTQVPP